jgi:hypothetical protein
MKVFNPLKSRAMNESDNLDDEADNDALICEAVNCPEKATTTIEVEIGDHRIISLSLCGICVNKFMGDD